MTNEQMAELAARLRVIAPLIPIEGCLAHEITLNQAADLIESMAQRVPLTADQIETYLPDEIYTTEDGWLKTTAQAFHDFARAIEQAHGIRSEK